MAEPRIGELRHLVDLERREITEGGTGDPVVTWVSVAKDLPARIRWLSAREFLQGLIVQSKVTAFIDIRWRPDVDQTMRLKRHIHMRNTPRGHELYNIEGILYDETGRKWIYIGVSQGVNDG